VGKITKYKVGDKVLFTFLGERLKGTITEKIDSFQFRVIDTSGYNYPFVYKKKPNKKEQVLSYIIEKL
jgi:acetolactate synthase small subunit